MSFRLCGANFIRPRLEALEGQTNLGVDGKELGAADGLCDFAIPFSERDKSLRLGGKIRLEGIGFRRDRISHGGGGKKEIEGKNGEPGDSAARLINESRAKGLL